MWYQGGEVIFVKYFLIHCFKHYFIHNDDCLVHERNCDFRLLLTLYCLPENVRFTHLTWKFLVFLTSELQIVVYFI